MNYGHLWTGIGNKQWVWLALDANTREIVGVYIGARDQTDVRKLWESAGVYIANAPLLRPISGRHMEPCCRRSGTGQWAKKRVRPAMWNDSTTH